MTGTAFSRPRRQGGLPVVFGAGDLTGKARSRDYGLTGRLRKDVFPLFSDGKIHMEPYG